jgi:hypothetical protein
MIKWRWFKLDRYDRRDIFEFCLAMFYLLIIAAMLKHW